MMLEACSIPLSSTFLQKLLVVNVDAEDRARIMAILSVVVLVCTSPFGWVAGQLSEINRSLPFMLNIGLFGAGVVLTMVASRWMRESHKLTTPDTPRNFRITLMRESPPATDNNYPTIDTDY